MSSLQDHFGFGRIEGLMKKAKIGIIGTGNIGTDLLLKSLRSDYLEPTLFMGRRKDSGGIELALIAEPDLCDIVFDATTAMFHYDHSRILHDLGKRVIDMTPARIGKMCIPSINSEECLHLDEINMITCGGQGGVPIVKAVTDAQPDVQYAEIIATISSKSAGIGTRENIDEFTQTTKEAMIEIGGVPNAKAIIILNPAEPPIVMHNTVFFQINNPNMEKITESVDRMVKKVQSYVPGYSLVLEPTEENGRITVMVQVVGLGDYFPPYAGNLDIINCAGIAMAEKWVLNND